MKGLQLILLTITFLTACKKDPSDNPSVIPQSLSISLVTINGYPAVSSASQNINLNPV
jgi:hypothetical protein